jgi:hypothetical protein
MKEKVSLIIVTIILIVTTSVIVFLMCQSFFEYITVLVIAEQNDHYYKMKENTQRLKKDIEDIQEDVENLTKNKLDKQEKKNLYEKLRELESVSLNISKEVGFYQEDTTVHLFFEPSIETISIFDKSRNIPIYIDRFIRTTELGLFEQYLTQDQSKIIQKNLNLLKKEMNSL